MLTSIYHNIQSVLSKKHALCESPQVLSSIFFLEREREPDFKNKETLLLKLLAGCYEVSTYKNYNEQNGRHDCMNKTLKTLLQV